MKYTFQSHRQWIKEEHPVVKEILRQYPRFLDVPGLVSYILFPLRLLITILKRVVNSFNMLFFSVNTLPHVSCVWALVKIYILNFIIFYNNIVLLFFPLPIMFQVSQDFQLMQLHCLKEPRQTKSSDSARTINVQTLYTDWMVKLPQVKYDLGPFDWIVKC